MDRRFYESHVPAILKSATKLVSEIEKLNKSLDKGLAVRLLEPPPEAKEMEVVDYGSLKRIKVHAEILLTYDACENIDENELILRSEVALNVVGKIRTEEGDTFSPRFHFKLKK